MDKCVDSKILSYLNFEITSPESMKIDKLIKNV